MGGRSNATGRSGKKWMTIEEREAAYNAARNRISMDFEEKEKEKEKEKDMSASSSSGLTSASASHAGSSVGDTDDASSSLATESEWSSNVPFPNGSSNSSGNSRASSPSFTSISELPAAAVTTATSKSPYMPPYPYYPPYAFGQPPQPPQNSSEGDPKRGVSSTTSSPSVWQSLHVAATCQPTFRAFSPPVPSQPPNGRMPGPQPHQLPQHLQPYP
ncbi:hypothetical protein D9758_019119 [Tetrapyrgos nigripes]|uniref:SUZ domain-containing protein n=1 Tax=Tetrapyrgos nigripes TaxID=182062 RepID=A0A8H5APY7_9AGAR|nr:hypothetical protein D9758_019119 [Tetrapyrgos nigripes]